MSDLHFRVHARGSQEWVKDGASIVSKDALARIAGVMQTDGPVIVEHWHYYGGRGPDHHVFEEMDAFLDYLRAEALAGDDVHVWSVPEVCRDDNRLAHGKCPDEDGCVPKGGAY